MTSFIYNFNFLVKNSIENVIKELIKQLKMKYLFKSANDVII